MLYVGNLRDLSQFGINVLTGEACAYGLRVLCDLTEDGAELVSAFLGGLRAGSAGATGDYPFQRNWNSGASYSVMLTRSLLFNELVVFALFRAGCVRVVIGPDNGVAGIFAHERKALAFYQELRGDAERSREYRFYSAGSMPGVDGRATHAFSGRTV